MVVLDVAIVNVALPSIGTDLNFSRDNLQWVITAYSLDLRRLPPARRPRRRPARRRIVFMTGVAIFTTASLLCGLAQSEAWLIVARAVQGFGAAMLTPAALSIITTTFTERAERNKALGVWGAVGGGGAAAGVLMGGILTEVPRLGVDLLRQRAGRHRSPSSRDAVDRHESRGETGSAGSTSPARFSSPVGWRSSSTRSHGRP